MISYGLILWLLYNVSAPTWIVVVGWICFVVKAIEWLIEYVL